MSRAERFRRLVETRESESTNPNKTDVINKIIGADEHENNRNSNTEHGNASLIINTNTDQVSTTLIRNSNAEQQYETVIRNSNTEQLDVTTKPKKPTKARIPRAIEEFEKRLKKPTVEETHTRGTWLIRNDLLKRLEKLAKNQQRGFKTYVVNYALEKVLDELEGK